MAAFTDMLLEDQVGFFSGADTLDPDDRDHGGHDSCPAGVRIAEQNGLEATARTLSLVGYTWMGGLFLFLSLLSCSISPA